jgi:hypothetical protein
MFDSIDPFQHLCNLAPHLSLNRVCRAFLLDSVSSTSVTSTSCETLCILSEFDSWKVRNCRGPARPPIEPNQIEFTNSSVRFDSIINIKVNSILNSTKFDQISNFIELGVLLFLIGHSSGGIDPPKKISSLTNCITHLINKINYARF